MARALTIAVFALLSTLSANAQMFNRMNVYATGGKSWTNWHGQADMQTLNFELSHAFSPRYEAGVVFAPMNFYQPRSWFGYQFGDGSEQVQAASVSMLGRRTFRVDAPTNVYVEASTGPMWSEERVPEFTSHFNFISQFGTGVVLNARGRFPLIVGYRFAHISNGGYSERNPGWNISSLLIGTRVRR